jgi:serine/threonine-protein kinase
VTVTVAAPIQDALPNYEIGGELGRGAMGVVFAAHHRRLARDVAIKQLPPAFAADQTVRERFGREARTLAALAHPHIVPIYDYVEEEGLCLLVMEALPGGTLWDRFITDGLTLVTACTALLATCEALEFAHEKGVLHRDVKPENLMFGADRTLKVTDFGIAEVFGGDETVTTVDGEVIGTPAYMAPEQAQGKPCGPQADVYAAATVLYELLSGTLPLSIEGESVEVLERRVHEDPTPLQDVAPQVPESLAVVTMRGLARDPSDRFSSAGELGVAIGDAATQSFGPGWVGRADLNLVLSGPIAAAAGPATQVETARPGEYSATGGGGRTGRETMIAGTGQPVPRDEPLRARATSVSRPHGARLDEISPEDLVRVDDLVAPPKLPWWQSVGTAILLLALLVVSGLGIGTPSVAGPMSKGQAQVAGVDVASGRTVSADLADDIRVRVRELPAKAERARYVRLAFSVLGVNLPPSRSGRLRDAGGDLVARVDAKRDRILWTGETTGRLMFLDSRKHELLSQEFHFDADRPFYLAFVGVFSLVVLAFVASYGWSATQPVRRGHRRRSVYLVMTVLGVVAGGALLGLGWSIFGSQPTPATIGTCAALGALTFLALAQVLVISGRRARLARAVERRAIAWTN